MAIVAINKKYQTLVTRAYKNLRKYYDQTDLDDNFDFDDYKGRRSNENKAAKFFDVYFNIFVELPKREQQNFAKTHKNIHGYEG